MNISVIVQVCNSEPFISQALESILAQNVSSLEILVVDDNSGDRSVAIAREYPDVRIIQLPKSGLGEARNQGVKAASGELIAFLDGDDYWTGDKLKMQLDYLSKNPDCAAVVGLMCRFVSEGCQLPPNYSLEMLAKPVPAYIPSALMVRRTIFEEIGLFDSSLAVGCDSDWMMRLLDTNKVYLLPQVMLHKRIHNHNISAQVSLYQQELLKALRRSLQRRGYVG
jgi:glycosyltransferase involved in cell wall biosynthesis